MKIKTVLCASLAVLTSSINLSSHALLIDATFDPGYNAAQQASVNNAISYFESTLTDNVTVKIDFKPIFTGLGSSSQYIYGVPYNTLYNALKADRTSANDMTAVSHLASGNSDVATGASYVRVTHAQCAAISLYCGPTIGLYDGTVGINLGLADATRSDGVSAGRYDMMAIVEHEIDELLGVGGPGSGLGHGFVGVEDLFRYTASGVRSYTTSGDNAYFSINGGVTDLARFNQNSHGDYADWWSTGVHTPEVQDAFGTPGTVINIGAAELTALDVVGWNLSTHSVPEPATLALVGLGLTGMGFMRRR